MSNLREKRETMTEQLIKRGILQTFNPTTYTATVLILEATSYVLASVPIATSVDGTSAIVGASCAVLFFDESNQTDAVIIAVYGQPVPNPTPGRITFVAGYQQLNAVTIASGSTNTYTLTGSGGIPLGALGVLYKLLFTSATAGAYLQMAPHNGTIGNYASFGNLPLSNATCNETGLIQVDANGQIDLKANVGTCTVSLYTFGYFF
jgi:hypothetical protein